MSHTAHAGVAIRCSGNRAIECRAARTTGRGRRRRRIPHIGAEIETISADQVDEACERVRNSDVRYRFVIDTATF